MHISLLPKASKKVDIFLKRSSLGGSCAIFGFNTPHRKWERLGLQDHGPFLQWFGTGLGMILFKQSLKCLHRLHTVYCIPVNIESTHRKRGVGSCFFFFPSLFWDCFFARGRFFMSIKSAMHRNAKNSGSEAGAWACFDEFNRIQVEVLSVPRQKIV